MYRSVEVGIRELRQDLSRYLRRVRRGERLVVTDRNRPVAMLTPLPGDEDPVDRLVAEGRATRPTVAGRGIRPTRLSDPYAGTKTLEEIRGDSDHGQDGGAVRPGRGAGFGAVLRY